MFGEPGSEVEVAPEAAVSRWGPTEIQDWTVSAPAIPTLQIFTVFSSLPVIYMYACISFRREF
jgi:hypothetical protein